MTYMRVEWRHGFADEPVWLYSELDDERWEVRKVEVFRDGTCGFASSEGETGTTRLGTMPTPTLEEIGRDPEFIPVEITREDFEAIWRERSRRPGTS